MLSGAFDRGLLIIYTAREVYLMFDKQQARWTSFPKELSMQIMQTPSGKAGSGMTGGANHVTEEDSDERRDKRCKPLRGIGRRLFDEGKRNYFPFTQKTKQKEAAGM